MENSYYTKSNLRLLLSTEIKLQMLNLKKKLLLNININREFNM